MRAAGLGIVLALAVSPARAAPMVVAWATWLHSGAGVETPVLNELPSGFVVDVVGCEGGWCRVVSGRAMGFVEQRLLAASRTAPLLPAEGECFPATHVTPERAIAMRICPANLGN